MLVSNSLLQQYFENNSISRYPLVRQKTRSKIQVTQNKSIRFRLKLN